MGTWSDDTVLACALNNRSTEELCDELTKGHCWVSCSRITATVQWQLYEFIDAVYSTTNVSGTCTYACSDARQLGPGHRGAPRVPCPTWGIAS